MSVCVRTFPPGQLAFARGVKRTLNEEKPFGLPGPKHNVRIRVHTAEIRKKHTRESGKKYISSSWWTVDRASVKVVCKNKFARRSTGITGASNSIMRVTFDLPKSE